MKNPFAPLIDLVCLAFFVCTCSEGEIPWDDRLPEHEEPESETQTPRNQ